MPENVVTILVFILILSVLVIIHELGHFFAARFFKIKVDEFGLGYPPRLTTLFRWKGIPFTLNAVPFGGFVKLAGEIPEDENAPRDRHQFWSRPGWQRLIVLLAGVFCNFIFGILAFTVLYSKFGIPMPPSPVVDIVAIDSPAQAAGLQKGDLFTAVADENGGNKVAITSIEQFKAVIARDQGKTVQISIRRHDKAQTVPAHIRTESERPPDQGLLGVAFPEISYVFYPWYEMPFRAAVVGTKESVLFGRMILVSLGEIGRQAVVVHKVTVQVSGPIGIVDQAIKQKLLSVDFFQDLNFAALLSINLAIINILPLPAMDGGRVFLLLFERLLNHQRRVKLENITNLIGMVLIVGLIVVISYSDIAHILQAK